MTWTRRKRNVILLTGTGGALVVVATLVLLAVPISQERSGYTLVGYRLYSFEAESVFGPAWSNYTYRGVTFEFHVWCAITPGGGELCGNVTESNGSTFPFSFWDARLSQGSQWETWVAPDSEVAIQYETGGLAHLLVAT